MTIQEIGIASLIWLLGIAMGISVAPNLLPPPPEKCEAMRPGVCSLLWMGNSEEERYCVKLRKVEAEWVKWNCGAGWSEAGLTIDRREVTP